MLSNDFNNGLAQLQAVIDIFNNKSAYEKQIKELEKHKKELAKMVAVVGKITEIDNIKKQILIEKDKIVQELETIKKRQADVTVEMVEAQARARSIEADAVHRVSDQQTALDFREKELTENRKQLGERERMLTLAEIKVKDMQAIVVVELKRVEHLQEATVNARKDFEKRHEQLEAALVGA